MNQFYQEVQEDQSYLEFQGTTDNLLNTTARGLGSCG